MGSPDVVCICAECRRPFPRDEMKEVSEQSWGGHVYPIVLCAPCYDAVVNEDGEPDDYDPFREHPWPC